MVIYLKAYYHVHVGLRRLPVPLTPPVPLTQTHVFPYRLPRRSVSDRMSRFSDPVVVENDLGVYWYSLALGSWLWIPENLTKRPLNSGPQVLLAYHKWPLHVGVIRYHVDSPLPALNFHSQMGVLDNS